MSKIQPLFENIRLNLVIVSDTHIDIKHPLPFIPKMFLKQSLSQSERSRSFPDAFLTVGDTTSRGEEINWKMTEQCFSGFKPAENIILTLGNHDCWNDNGYDTAINLYYKYFKNICGFEIDKPYFSRIINGYHLIFLGNDAEAGCEANIGDEQFDWFCREMEAAGESNKPIIVFCHQSLNGKHGLPRTWDRHEIPDRDPDDGGVGARSKEIENELKKYNNVFYFSGHSHMGFAGEKTASEEGYSSIEQEDGVTLINLPSLSCNNHHGENNKPGWGMVMEIYDDKVILRPRNFSKNRWNTHIIMSDGNPYYEVQI